MLIVVKSKAVPRHLESMSMFILGLEKAERTEPAIIDRHLFSPLRLTPASSGT